MRKSIAALLLGTALTCPALAQPAVVGNGSGGYTGETLNDVVTIGPGQGQPKDSGVAISTVPSNAGPNTWVGTQTFDGQIVTATGLPTIASGACGATTNGAVVAGSTNQSGEITIGSASTSSCTVSFSATLGAAPLGCLIQPANATAAAVGTTGAYVSAITTAHFVITGTLASANYYYFCM